jgi:hypothetical protein
VPSRVNSAQLAFLSFLISIAAITCGSDLPKEFKISIPTARFQRSPKSNTLEYESWSGFSGFLTWDAPARKQLNSGVDAAVCDA